jgi:hypothetical protein
LLKKVLKGTKQFNIVKITPQSTSATSTSWVWQPPSQNTITDRRIDLEYQVNLTTTGADFQDGPVATGNWLYPTKMYNNLNLDGGYTQFAAGSNRYGATVGDATCSNNIAVRQFPLANAMNSIELDINGTHFSSSVSDYIQAVMRYTTVEYRERVFNETGHMPDRNDYAHTVGTDKHALMYDLTGFQGETPRGKIAINTTAPKELAVTVREPLFLSPLLQHFGEGMTNINSLAVTINWKANPLPYMWSLCLDAIDGYGCGVQAVANSLTTAALSVDLTKGVTKNLICRYFTPQDDIDIPSQISIPYVQPVIRKSTFPSTDSSKAAPFLTKNASVTGDNIRLSQIPSSVYLYVKLADSSKNVNDAVLFADVFGQITGVNIQWGNQSRLSELTGNDLRQIAVDNGCDDLFTNHSGDGYVLKLRFGKDIGLENNETPGMRGDFSFQCTISSNYPDISRDDVGATNFEFCQVFMYEGQVQISPNQCMAETGIISISDSIEAKDDHLVEDGGSYVGGSSVGGSLVGGSITGKIKKGIKVYNKAKIAGNAINDVVNEYQSRG